MSDKKFQFHTQARMYLWAQKDGTLTNDIVLLNIAFLNIVMNIQLISLFEGIGAFQLKNT